MKIKMNHQQTAKTTIKNNNYQVINKKEIIGGISDLITKEYVRELREIIRDGESAIKQSEQIHGTHTLID